MVKVTLRTTEFDGKVAIITGAASGIGEAVAYELLEQGVKLVVADNNKEALAHSFPATNKEIMKRVRADISKREDRELLLATALQYGRVDYLVNAAGVIRVKEIFEVTEEEWDFIQDINAKSCFFMCQLIGDHWVKNGQRGNIVNFSSSAATLATTSAIAAYSASKASVVAITKTFAQVLATTGSRVNCVAPGIIETPMQEALQHQLINELADEVTRDSRLAKVPMQREGTREEVASVVRFLLSEDSSYMTGQSINITGGMVMD